MQKLAGQAKHNIMDYCLRYKMIFLDVSEQKIVLVSIQRELKSLSVDMRKGRGAYARKVGIDVSCQRSMAAYDSATSFVEMASSYNRYKKMGDYLLNAEGVFNQIRLQLISAKE
ncbi:hypothetical protein A134_23285 [Vibrio crassostreae 9CS106]|uniref:Uncharacterized protein n=1 Tax=Vibrio crassostreae 9CS106 TaxID=1191300 RepID=A0A1B1C3F5_9VIBR|nr:hypothetical protein A134_23285 [Vibrio crassostreae 9CS106]